MKDRIIRLQEEKNELHGNMVALRKFLEHRKHLTLPVVQGYLLEKQLKAMTEYYEILNIRIADLLEREL